MEDDKGLELSLSLAWCQSSSKSKEIGDNSSDTKPEEVDRSSKLINDFKHFLEGGTGKPESGTSSQRTEPSNPEEKNLWILNDNKRTELVEEKEPESSNKRKFFFEEINNKKHERESHISINTDDGSTAENEDVADSEGVENNGKKLNFDTGKEVYSVFDTSAVDVTGQRGFTITPEKEFTAGKMPYNVNFPSNSVNILNMPHAVSAEDFGNVSAAFGYPSVQLPVLDKDNSKGFVSHIQQLHPSYPERFPATIGKINDVSSRVSQVMHKSSEGKLHVQNSVPKEEPDKLPSELSSITPGIASDLKFGGCGSYPNLPWVSTKGTGPNGRIISGVTYKFSSTQIKIVCACHGSHMSPEEFIRHASEEQSGPQSGSGLASLPNDNHPAASTKS